MEVVSVRETLVYLYMLEKELHTGLLRCVNSGQQSMDMKHEIMDIFLQIIAIHPVSSIFFSTYGLLE